MTWGELRTHVRARLVAGGNDAAALESGWIVERVSGADADAVDDEPAPAVAVARAVEMADRRVGGEPLQYVLGEWSFRGFDVMVDPRVLVPRPETEVTAEVAVDEAIHLGLRPGPPDAWAAAGTGEPVADLGTGSGVLALALAHGLADVEVWGTDADAEALAVARANVAGAGRIARCIRLVEGDWFDALPAELAGRLRLVASNPPYVSDAEVDELPSVVADHEPRHALVAGPTGFEAIAAIVADAPAWLAPRAALVVEIAPHQHDAALGAARDAGFDEAVVRPDLSGRPRVLVARRAPRDATAGARP